MKDHLNGTLVHVELFRKSEVHQQRGSLQTHEEQKKQPEKMQWIKFKCEKFSAPFMMMIILCLASKHLQALYTYYVVQAKS